jgi:hypothetical protein
MKHPGESSRRWVLPEYVEKSEKFGYVRVEPTPDDARPHDKLAISVEVPRPASLSMEPDEQPKPKPKKGKGKK